MSETDETGVGMKTLEAYLLPLTAHKREKVNRLCTEFQAAFTDAFSANADTMSAVNDIVTPYNLPYQAKDALKSHVPKLLDEDTYGAKELAESQPIRFVNRAATYDFNPVREHSFTWQVPMPGHGTNFWIPLQINPSQEQLWHELLDEDSDVKASDIQLLKDGDRWKIHQTINYPVEDTSDTDSTECTKVGFDIGESKLLVGCALQQQDGVDDTPVDPLFVDGGRARQLRKEMYTTLVRLQERGAAQWRINERFEYYENALTDIVEKATRRAVEYAKQFDDSMIILEDLTDLREDLDYGSG